ncbi:MAG: circadian clock protein KaiA, partial [Microcystis panniformis]
MPPRLTIYAFVPTDSPLMEVSSPLGLVNSLTALLANERYNLTLGSSSSELLANIEAEKEKIDC